MTAQEAREISKRNDLSSVYALISNAAYKGEYSVSTSKLNKENTKALLSQGYCINNIEIGCIISWRDVE
jgi:hypothetical protein